MPLMGSYTPPPPKAAAGLMGGGGGGSAPILSGTVPQGYNPAYGGKPVVPNPTATAGSAISGNIGNLGGLYQLGGGVNPFQTQQFINAYNMAIPNYSGMAGLSSENIGAELQGDLPQDVVNQIVNRAAERGIMTGSPGSPNTNAALVEQLLGSSLALTQSGEQELSGAVARSPIMAPYDVSRMFVTPDQQQQAAAAANVYAAAPQPAAAAQALEGLAGGGPEEQVPWWTDPYVRTGGAVHHLPGGFNYYGGLFE